MDHPSTVPAANLRRRLRADLVEARRAHDRDRSHVIRMILSALDNAEAVDPATVLDGATEVARRVLTRGDIEGLLHREAAELESAAADYDRLAPGDEGDRLRRRAGLVVDYLSYL